MERSTLTPLTASAALANPELCRNLLKRLEESLDAPLRFMEVCGTHTVAIFRSGLRSLLPEGVTHLSGPGCPVCVTHDREIAAVLELALNENCTIATFGDLLRVPGPDGLSLKKAMARGASVEVVYSPLDALTLAQKHPDREIVFLGVGFETTAPAVAATIQQAAKTGLANFSVLAFHKLVPPALDVLLEPDQNRATDAPAGIDAFLLPGHVCTITGLEPFRFLAERCGKSGIVGGFDPADILEALLLMVRLRKEGRPAVVNSYRRVVADEGNPKARSVCLEVFEPADALWRGIGLLPQSGLAIRPAYAPYDAMRKFALSLPEVPPIRGCQCGEVLKGLLPPDQCRLFGKACTPANPVGPCMVSTEGSCSAYYKYST
jgi:hydrogenase expression/formation protein HypD